MFSLQVQYRFTLSVACFSDIVDSPMPSCFVLFVARTARWCIASSRSAGDAGVNYFVLSRERKRERKREREREKETKKLLPLVESLPTDHPAVSRECHQQEDQQQLEDRRQSHPSARSANNAKDAIVISAAGTHPPPPFPPLYAAARILCLIAVSPLFPAKPGQEAIRDFQWS